MIEKFGMERAETMAKELARPVNIGLSNYLKQYLEKVNQHKMQG
jgi:hypothetical protein